jgi:hypothetical protein
MGKYDCGQFGGLIDKGSSFKVAEGIEVVLYQHCFSTGDRQIKKTIRGPVDVK